jgi:mannosidase alpha-like ER degradation enhancer 2
MKKTKYQLSRSLAAFAIILLGSSRVYPQTFTEADKLQMRVIIKAACVHSWNGYKQYAWGSDALKPISKVGHNWYSTSLLMTPVDAFDTFYLLGMQDEAKESKDLIFEKLSFNLDQEVQVFEMTIRLLGGLESAYELDGDKRFLTLAEDLGKRLLPAFHTPSGMPYRYINLQTGKMRDSISNPAEVGTLFLEFGKLTQLTGDSSYYKAARKAIVEIYYRRSKLNLIGSEINVLKSQWVNTASHIGGGIDSYFEYLYKAGVLFGDPMCKNAWMVLSAAVKKQLARPTVNGTFFTQADMNTGKEIFPEYGALQAFYAGTLALAGDLKTAVEVQKANFYMWTKFNMEPEAFNFMADTITYNGYHLRPENIESCFYLYRSTHNDIYLEMGRTMVNQILEKCKTEAGYASIKNVKTFEKSDSMESFFLAETMKYAYLLFDSSNRVDLTRVVFNTEAHPLKIK